MTLALDLSRRLTGRDQLVRALGKSAGVVRVVDATAGLGRDAAGLASAGFDVTAIERAPALVELWQRASASGALPPGLRFVEGDARAVLAELASAGGAVDAVYIDPMYPAGKRKSAPRRAMVDLRALVGDDDDGAIRELLDTALATARMRVVVKRPKRAAPLLLPPDHQWVGASTRYDAYFVKARAAR